MKRAYVETPQGQIHYRTAGSGEPVLLIHSTPRSSWEYELVLPVLGKRYWAIAMDNPGYGESDRPSGQYEISDYARCVADFLDALGIGRVTIGGHHTGAMIAAETAVIYPERVKGLVLSALPFYTPEEYEKLKQGTPEYLRPLVSFELKEDGSHLLTIWDMEQSSRKPPLKSLEELQEMVMAELKGAPNCGDTFRAVWRYESRKRLPLVKSPTLVINPTGDRYANRGTELVRLIPAGRVATIESGNYIPRNEPEKFAEAIMEFIEGLDS
jgi:pimeloyl-ACP methyl ester carboxylesterase